MERDSVSVSQAVCNGKPTVIDFYADWCESCKVMAPTMRDMEIRYRDNINFIAIDGSSPRNADMVKRFNVDGIPQIAFVSPGDSGGEVITNLVGAVPKKIMKEEMEALLKIKEKSMQSSDFPYLGFELPNPYPLKDVIENNRCSLSVGPGGTSTGDGGTVIEDEASSNFNMNINIDNNMNRKDGGQRNVVNDPTAAFSFYKPTVDVSSVPKIPTATVARTRVSTSNKIGSSQPPISQELNDLLKSKGIVDILQGH